MIKNIFLPEKINAYYLFTQRIAAFEVGPTSVQVTVIRAHRKKRSIQQFLEESYDPKEEHGLHEAVKKILKKIKPYDIVYVALPSTNAIFKELTVPFTNLEKIKLVLPFEVESLLPFPMSESVVDGIINSKDQKNNSSNVFVVAMKRSTLDSYIQPFIEAGIRPQRVTLGSLELYGMIQNIETYRSKKGVSALIDMNSNTTRIIIMVNGQIKTIRILPEGIDPELMRLDLGVGQDSLSNDTQNFFDKIQFTIQATLKNEKVTEKLQSVLLSGMGAHITGITKFVSDLLGCPSQILQAHKIIHDGTISIENGSSIPHGSTISLATALSCPIMESFNLGRHYNEEQENKLFTKQFIVAATLLILLVLGLGIYNFMSIRTLNNEIESSKEQVTKRLIREFNLTLKGKQKDSLSVVINNTQQKLTLEESIWFALSTSKRFSFLHYLQELSTRVDRQDLGLELKRLMIKSDERSGEDIVTLEGAVRDYDALRTLEENLQDTKLFMTVPKLQETKFNISLVIDKNGEEQS